MLNYYDIHLTVVLCCVVALLSVTLLLIIIFFSRWLFAKYNISKRRQNVLTALSVVLTAIVLFGIIFSPMLYTILEKKDGGLKKYGNIFSLFVLTLTLVAFVLLAAINYARKPRKSFFTTKNMTRLAVFTALSVVLYLVVKFPLPFIFPEFLDIQFSDMPALLAGFMMGPEAGAIVIVLKCLIKLPMTGTAGVGELADLILGLVFVVSSSLIYKRLRSKNGAIIALVFGSVFCIVAAIITNRYILVPFYTEFLLPWPVLIGMVKPLYKAVTKENFYLFYLWAGILPFNILRCLVTSVITFFLYKPTKRIFGVVEKTARSRRKKLND